VGRQHQRRPLPRLPTMIRLHLPRRRHQRLLQPRRRQRRERCSWRNKNPSLTLRVGIACRSRLVLPAFAAIN